MAYGLLAKKLGMTQVFQEDGTVDAVTVLQAGPCTVTQIKTIPRDGYAAVQLGFGFKRRMTKPALGHLNGLGNFRTLREVSPKNTTALEVGTQIKVNIFETGERVNVTGTSKGKGFAGAVKRHHFAGGPKTHGQKDRHRAPGSLGAGTTPGRVFKGQRMAGHMGNAKSTSLNVEVVQVDADRDLLIIKGSIPGPRNGLVTVWKTQERD